jgi:hypothetical protein
MLVGDDVFIKGIRLGIDQDDYVYQSGDLLRGKGDPHAEIKVDEQSFIYTTSYAQEHGIWPRQEAKSEAGKTDSSARPADGQTDQGSGDYAATTDRTMPKAKSPPVLEAEDVLKAALTRLLEKRGTTASAAWRR